MAPRAPAVCPSGLALAGLMAIALSCLTSPAEAGCYLERGVTTPNELDAYTCQRSQDFQKDLDRLPLNTTKLVNVSFRESKVPKIEKDSLQKLKTKVLGISIVHCGLADIDEEAFRGLTELKALILRRNRLTKVKKEWFKDLAKLESLDLSGNEIREFDPAIFELTPQIQEFEISENQVSHFDVEAMKAKWPKLKKVGLQSNPYEWAQGVKVIEYSNQHPSVVKNSYASIDGMRDTYKLVLECQATMAKKDDAKELDNCVKAKLAKAIESPKLLEGEVKPEPTKPL
ncbi:leucine-rich repeat and transmembrane domain-containing protein 1-like [Copidosoma floridanum]|uniref:leucine-rich repeat and transmembrane domain-containing protein 1-like n=1 Tax=Copidosoma floridanum TaxID=29053 RepID=UPI0006C9A25C|nr:leucine-rich repeat and transmembrane domain-containing protein 1-like [Copidosoma floridanum]